MGKIREDVADRARLDGGKSADSRKWVLAKKRKATTPLRPVFKASANGRITSRTAIFWKRFLNSSFDWNGIRAPYIVATENDCLNGASMLFGHLLTNTAQIFADVRTYWSADSVKRVSGHKLAGAAANGILHLINSGPATLDGTGQQI